ncbi:unnamed protein product [Rhizoctonia solani]|uniref:Cupin type-1 domain-containing protein n=1 Tax=Rhizoctonia solani TaxID=456999 RepID=A0A8H2XPH8_9AGAM|nr:unnamed protein product [Rhizoctonia solani]
MAPAGPNSSLPPDSTSNPAPASPTTATTNTSDATLPSPTVAYASDDPNDLYLDQYHSGTPELIIGAAGANILGPQNIPLERESPDFLVPPTTILDQSKTLNGPWQYLTTECKTEVHDMSIATAMVGVDMRLKAGAIRELHWHVTAEWGYVMAGSCRVNMVDQLGHNYLTDVCVLVSWRLVALPPKVFLIQSDGCESLLVLDNGDFSEDSTFLLTDWTAHVSKEVLAKYLRMNASAFDDIPSEGLWMLPSAVPTQSVAEANPVSPQGPVPLPFTFAASKALATNVTQVTGGSVKVIDSRTFNISKTIVVVEVTVVPGGIRLHWHPTQPEWTYFLEGNARVTGFASSANARTFDYQAGDIGYVPPPSATTSRIPVTEPRDIQDYHLRGYQLESVVGTDPSQYGQGAPSTG